MCFICYKAQVGDSGLFSIAPTLLLSRLTQHLRDAFAFAWASALKVKNLDYARPESITNLFPLDGARLSKLIVIFNIWSHNDGAGLGISNLLHQKRKFSVLRLRYTFSPVSELRHKELMGPLCIQ